MFFLNNTRGIFSGPENMFELINNTGKRFYYLFLLVYLKQQKTTFLKPPSDCTMLVSDTVLHLLRGGGVTRLMDWPWTHASPHCSVGFCPPAGLSITPFLYWPCAFTSDLQTGCSFCLKTHSLPACSADSYRPTSLYVTQLLARPTC